MPAVVPPADASRDTLFDLLRQALDGVLPLPDAARLLDLWEAPK